MADKIHIISYTVCDYWDCFTNKLVKGIGSPLKTGSLNLVLNRLPEFIYERHDNLFYAVDNGFVGLYERKPGMTSAFSGDKFNILMKDGSVYHSNGDLWYPTEDEFPPYDELEPFVELLGFDICFVGLTTYKDNEHGAAYPCYVDINIINNLLDVTIGRCCNSSLD